jgi:hypothetical protein
MVFKETEKSEENLGKINFLHIYNPYIKILHILTLVFPNSQTIKFMALTLNPKLFLRTCKLCFD